MTTKIRIEFDSRGFRDILHYDSVRELVDEYGENLAQQAGEGYAYKSSELNYGGGRVGGYVYTGDNAAMVDQAENHTLERLVSA